MALKSQKGDQPEFQWFEEYFDAMLRLAGMLIASLWFMACSIFVQTPSSKSVGPSDNEDDE